MSSLEDSSLGWKELLNSKGVGDNISGMSDVPKLEYVGCSTSDVSIMSELSVIVSYMSVVTLALSAVLCALKPTFSSV